MSLNIVVTSAGRAKIVNAQNTGTAPLTITQVGLSQTAVTPAASATTLAGEFKRISGVGGDAIAPDTIHINMTDTSGDAYSLRSFALYLADGTLFAIYGQATPMIEKVAASDALLAIDVVFADISAASLTFGNTNFLNPPATTEHQGVIELATVAEAQAGIDALRALTPAAAKAAILGWLLGMDGSGSGIDADLLDGYHASAFAQLSGATFSGAIRRDSQFYMHVTPGGLPMLVFGDDGGGTDRIEFNRDFNTWVFSRAGNESLAVFPTGLLTNGAPVWAGNNDGSGSGLDADLWRGLDQTTFVRTSGTQTLSGTVNVTNGTGVASLSPTGDITATRGDGTGVLYLNNAKTRFLYWDGAGYYLPGGQLSVGGNVVWTTGNDGAGSGLDADTVDGLQASVFALLSGATFTGNVFMPDLYVTSGDINISRTTHPWGYITRPNVAGYKKLQFAAIGGGALENIELNAVDVTKQGNPVWHAGNDGAGSGLDADLLDGKHASEIIGQQLGVGVDLYNVLASRAVNTGYRNTYGKPIFVIIQANGDFGQIQISKDNIAYQTMCTTIDHGRCQTVVPDGWYVRVSGSPVLEAWLEIR